MDIASFLLLCNCSGVLGSYYSTVEMIAEETRGIFRNGFFSIAFLRIVNTRYEFEKRINFATFT